MIYFTTFIFMLLLSHTARAIPACGDVAHPEELYDTTFTVAQHAPSTVISDVTWSSYYDIPNGDTKKVVCSQLAPRYPHFKNFPHFPYIGGVQGGFGRIPCGKCVKLKNIRPPYRTIYITIMDYAQGDYNISKEAFNALNGGPGMNLLAEPSMVDSSYCNPN